MIFIMYFLSKVFYDQLFSPKRPKVLPTFLPLHILKSTFSTLRFTYTRTSSIYAFSSSIFFSFKSPILTYVLIEVWSDWLALKKSPKKFLVKVERQQHLAQFDTTDSRHFRPFKHVKWWNAVGEKCSVSAWKTFSRFFEPWATSLGILKPPNPDHKLALRFL